MPQLNPLESLTFDNRFTNNLPADPNPTNSRREVRDACYSRVSPTEVSGPQLVAYSAEVAELIGLNSTACESELFANVFAGNTQVKGMDPFAMCYGGHQFGNWAGQLGDGRAINLGEVRAAEEKHWTLQLKGAGPTPYSRTADGLAVLRSSVREFLCSEAMFHLGVPTTRALSLVLTGEQVMRDMMYDGNPQLEPGAVVCRVAPSFTRFGNFQIFAARGENETLRQLVDHTIRNDFAHLLSETARRDSTPVSNELIAKWFDEVCQTTAEMVVHWMRVGFVHGVMNTDNMSILGLTIDYGPYGWLENYDPTWTPNTTDSTNRRYRFGNQPGIAHWNLYQLANAIVQLTEDPKPFEESLERYGEAYSEQYKSMMAAKLGLNVYSAETDEPLIGDLLDILQLTETDMTIFFRNLAKVSGETEASADNTSILDPIRDAWYTPDSMKDEVPVKMAAWLREYQSRIRSDGTTDAVRQQRMNSVNPKYVLRNYMAQLAIDKSEKGDHSLVNELLDVLRHPYDDQPDREQHAEKRPDWARDRVGCSMLSCSS